MYYLSEKEINEAITNKLENLDISNEEKSIYQKQLLSSKGYNEDKINEMREYKKSLEESIASSTLLTQLIADDDIPRYRIAQILGIPEKTLIQISKGRIDPSLTTALCIAKYFNKTIDELFGV